MNNYKYRLRKLIRTEVKEKFVIDKLDFKFESHENKIFLIKILYETFTNNEEESYIEIRNLSRQEIKDYKPEFEEIINSDFELSYVEEMEKVNLEEIEV